LDRGYWTDRPRRWCRHDRVFAEYEATLEKEIGTSCPSDPACSDEDSGRSSKATSPTWVGTSAISDRSHNLNLIDMRGIAFNFLRGFVGGVDALVTGLTIYKTHHDKIARPEERSIPKDKRPSLTIHL